MSFIEVDHLSHSYHIEKDVEYKALQDINLSIEAGQFGVFPPEKWHCIEALSEDTVFNVDFYVDPKILIEG